MSLFQVTLTTAVVLLVLGAALLWNGAFVESLAKASLRSLPSTILFFGGGAAWFVWRIYNLGEADFGEYKPVLLLLFGGIAVGAFFVARDFLAVRGLAILVLMASQHILDLARFQLPQSRLFLVSFIYVAILLALYLGALPFALRDFFNWLWTPGKSARPRAFGALLAGYGAVLTAVALTYPQ